MTLTFEQAWEKHQPMLQRAVRKMMHNSPDADDVLQDAAVRMWRKWSSFDGRCNASTWMYRVVFNTMLMHVRKGKAKIFSQAVSLDLVGDGHLGHDHSGFGRLEAAEQLQALPIGGRDRQILLDRYHLGLSQLELCEKYEVPLSTMKTRICHALRRARRRRSQS